jgi:tungstate transport system substrate-binding protein
MAQYIEVNRKDGEEHMALGSMNSTRRVLQRIAPLMALVMVAAACSSAGSTPQASQQAASPSLVATASPTATPVTPGSAGNLILASTTSLQDSGLLDVLVPAFEKASGYSVKTVAVGSGAAITLGQQGNADVMFVHSPTQEQAFIDAGWGVDRRLVAHNYFWIVGPKSDPAAITGVTSGVDAFKKIAAAKATFVSRGDASGTNTKELGLWKSAGITTPITASWYVSTGQGMGPTLQIASQKGGYTLTDTATFLASQSSLSLQPMLKGDTSMVNIYSVIGVNPAKWPKVNAAGAKAFEDFVTGTAGQQIIGTFGTDKYGVALFTADAGKDYSSIK